MTFKCERLNHFLGPFWQLQVKGNLFCLSSNRLVYKQQKRVCEFFISKYFSAERVFYDHSIFFKSYFENTVEPHASDHPKCQALVVAYKSLDHIGSNFASIAYANFNTFKVFSSGMG